MLCAMKGSESQKACKDCRGSSRSGLSSPVIAPLRVLSPPPRFKCFLPPSPLSPARSGQLAEGGSFCPAGTRESRFLL